MINTTTEYGLSNWHFATNPSWRKFLVGLGLWSVVSFGLGYWNVLLRGPIVIVPASILGLTTTGVLLYQRSKDFRGWVEALPIKLLVGYHLIRILFGGLFLLHANDGSMPHNLAMRAGIGDLAVGVLAIAVLLWVRVDNPLGRKLMFAWNIFGFLDIAMVFLSFQREIVFGRGVAAVPIFRHFPFSILPLIIVPLVVLTHFAIFAALNRAKARATGEGLLTKSNTHIAERT